MTIKICPGCSAEMDADAIFCNECGLASVASGVVLGVEADPVGGVPAFPQDDAGPGRATSRVELPVRDLANCALCGAEIDAAAKLCSKCTLNIGLQFAANPSATTPEPQWRPSGSEQLDRRPSGEAAQFTESVRTRYRDAYYYSRFIDTIGKILKGIGFVGGGIIFFVGIVIMGSGLRSGISSVDSGAAGLMLFVFGLYGGLWMFIWWLWGVVWRAAGQFLKASLDGAVHSSPFLSDMDRAEIMSLSASSKKTAGAAPATKQSGHSNAVPVGPSPWEQMQTWMGKQDAGRAIIMAYLVPLILPVLVFAFGVSLATESRLFSLIPSFFGLPVTAVTIYLILSVRPHKTDKLVRFHSYQALALFGLWAAVQLFVIVVSNLLSPAYEFEVPFPLVLFNVFGSLAVLLAIAVAASKGNNREYYSIPIVGEWVRKRLGKSIDESSRGLGV